MNENFTKNRSVAAVKSILEGVMHPEINASLVELGMTKVIEADDNSVKIVLKLPFLTVPVKDLLVTSIKTALKGYKSIELREEEMTMEERTRFMALARSKWRF